MQVGSKFWSKWAFLRIFLVKAEGKIPYVIELLRQSTDRLKKQHNIPYLLFSHPWTRETRLKEFWVFSKIAQHSSLIPRSSELFMIVVELNFPPWGPLWMSKSQPTCALWSLISLGCSTPHTGANHCSVHNMYLKIGTYSLEKKCALYTGKYIINNRHCEIHKREMGMKGLQCHLPLFTPLCSLIV